jgi:hypothetical protein
MRWPLSAAVAILIACQGNAGVRITIDVPGGTLDPIGYAAVEVRILDEQRELVKSAQVIAGAFELGEIDSMRGVTLEATLRSSAGAVVGYGRGPGAIDLQAGDEIVIPVRRPMIYLGATNRTTIGGTETAVRDRVSYVDLSPGNSTIDRNARIASFASHVVYAGGELFGLEQDIDPVSERGTGSVRIRSVSSSDHSVAVDPLPLSSAIEGSINDATASEDGTTVAVATEGGLYLALPESRTVALAEPGAWSRSAATRSGIYAIKNRGLGAACTGSAQLVRVAARDAQFTATIVATGGFIDLASDGSRLLVLDCQGALSEVSGDSLVPVQRGLVGATAIAVAGRQVWIATRDRSTVSILSFALQSPEPPRVIWSQAITQTLTATRYPGVIRTLTPNAVTINELEIGGGGEYVAASVLSSYDQPAIPQANFPRFIVESDELWVLSARTGAVAIRYRPWCNGVFVLTASGQISEWDCARETGQQAALDSDAHRIRSMAFVFGAR